MVQRSGMQNVWILWLTKEKLDTSSEWIQIFYTYGKMQESGLLEIIPLIITWTRASIYSFCLKSVLQATLAASAVNMDLIVGNLISSRVPTGFTFMDRFKGLWLDACSIICLLIWLSNFLVHSVLYSLQPQKKLLSLERLYIYIYIIMYLHWYVQIDKKTHTVCVCVCVCVSYFNCTWTFFGIFSKICFILRDKTSLSVLHNTKYVLWKPRCEAKI